MQEDKPDQQQIIHKVMFSASYKLRRTGRSYSVTSTWFHPFLLQKTNVNTETKSKRIICVTGSSPERTTTKVMPKREL